MGKWVMPFPQSKITGHYGTLSAYRKKMGMQAHSGTDWAMPSKTLIPAITDGTIKLIQFSKILGWVVVQTGWDVKAKKTKYIGYCHLWCDKHGAKCGGPSAGCKSPSTSFKLGQKVKVGEKFGIRVSTTGSASTGNHLHATLGNSVKSVFGTTAQKEDLYRFIQSQSKGEAPKQANPQTKAVVESGTKTQVAPATKIVYACPHCKKELN